MIVPMMNVGIMGMHMAQRQMSMGVHMRLLAVPTVVMCVLVMGIVAVRMGVGHRLMLMIVLVIFR